jgi:hypothetical protein
MPDLRRPVGVKGGRRPSACRREAPLTLGGWRRNSRHRGCPSTWSQSSPLTTASTTFEGKPACRRGSRSPELRRRPTTLAIVTGQLQAGTAQRTCELRQPAPDRRRWPGPTSAPCLDGLTRQDTGPLRVCASTLQTRRGGLCRWRSPPDVPRPRLPPRGTPGRPGLDPTVGPRAS